MQSGSPYTVTGNISLFGLTGTVRQRADYVGGSIQIDGAGANQWFNAAAFALPPVGRLGDSGAGVVRGPGLLKSDFSLRKNFVCMARM
jgi:hypothetical protein